GGEGGGVGLGGVGGVLERVREALGGGGPRRCGALGRLQEGGRGKGEILKMLRRQVATTAVAALLASVRPAPAATHAPDWVVRAKGTTVAPALLEEKPAPD